MWQRRPGGEPPFYGADVSHAVRAVVEEFLRCGSWGHSIGQLSEELFSAGLTYNDFIQIIQFGRQGGSRRPLTWQADFDALEEAVRRRAKSCECKDCHRCGFGPEFMSVAQRRKAADNRRCLQCVVRIQPAPREASPLNDAVELAIDRLRQFRRDGTGGRRPMAADANLAEVMAEFNGVLRFVGLKVSVVSRCRRGRPVDRATATSCANIEATMEDYGLLGSVGDYGLPAITCRRCHRGHELGAERFKRCPRCRSPYCSRGCQRADWAEHKLVCVCVRCERGY